MTMATLNRQTVGVFHAALMDQRCLILGKEGEFLRLSAPFDFSGFKPDYSKCFFDRHLLVFYKLK